MPWEAKLGWNRGGGIKPSGGKKRKVREGSEARTLLASSSRPLTQTDINLSEENFHQTGRSEEEQARRCSNYSGSKIPSPSQFFPCLVATVIPSLTPARSWCCGWLQQSRQRLWHQRDKEGHSGQDSHRGLDGRLGQDQGSAFTSIKKGFPQGLYTQPVL